MRKCAWQEAGDRNYMSQARSAAHIQSFMGAEVHRLPQKIVSSVGETYGCPTGHPVKKIKENSLICRNRGEVFAASARRKFPAIITIRERQYIDRKSDVEGKRVSVRVDLGGRRINK